MEGWRAWVEGGGLRHGWVDATSRAEMSLDRLALFCYHEVIMRAYTRTYNKNKKKTIYIYIYTYIYLSIRVYINIYILFCLYSFV